MRAVDLADQIKWWDTLDTFMGSFGHVDVERGLQLARESRHPDAVWLASLFPAGVPVTRELMRDVLLGRGNDPRAMHLAFELANGRMAGGPLVDAALMGYAPAEFVARVRFDCVFLEGRESTESFLEKAAARGYRRSITQWGHCVYRGWWERPADVGKAFELWQESAALECPFALFACGELMFGPRDWERWYWWGRAASRGYKRFAFCCAIVELLPLFENCELGRVLHTVGALVKSNLNVAQRECYGVRVSEEKLAGLLRLLELYEAIRGRAKQAIAAWSMAGRRCGVVRDMRVMIAKMAWQEVWRLGEQERAEQSDAKRLRVDVEEEGE
jgi:hypothetical protein